MKEKNKTRMKLAFLLLVLSLFAVTIGATLVGLGAHILQFGLHAPEWWGWGGSVLVCGLAGIWTCFVGVLILLVSSVVRCKAPARHAVVQTLSAVLFGILSGFCWLLLKAPIPSMIAGGILTAGLAVVIAVIETKKMQNHTSEGICQPADGLPKPSM
jgi:hypothetical protein